MVPVDERERLNLFEQTMLPHLDAAYNLARWLAGNDHDAQDVTQEASLRAFKFFGSFRGENARAWLLTIVRNTFYNWLQKNRPPEDDPTPMRPPDPPRTCSVQLPALADTRRGTPGG